MANTHESACHTLGQASCSKLKEGHSRRANWGSRYFPQDPSLIKQQDIEQIKTICGRMAHTCFLDLPCEIRLQIYHLIYLSSAVPSQRIAPYISITTHVAGAVFPGPGTSTTGPAIPPKTRLLSSLRLWCYVPTSLLQSCGQIYHEARRIPFHENEFHFVNWFVLALKTAVGFSEGLKPWQRAEWRYARLEVYAEDISREDLHAAEWIELCGGWKGLRGLRLTLKMEGHGSYCHGPQQSKRALRDVWELADGRTGWISQGLGRLNELQQIEVELCDEHLTSREKVRWCGLLQELLRASSGRNHVLVGCIQ